MHVEFFDDAAAEIEQDRAWYRKRSEMAEAGFLRELDHAIEQVTDAPAQWPRNSGRSAARECASAAALGAQLK